MPLFDNPTIDLPGDSQATVAPGGASRPAAAADSNGHPCLDTVAGTELVLPAPQGSEGGASFIKKRVASYLHLDLKATDIQALLGLSVSSYEALLKDPEVLLERKRIAADELHRAAFLRLQLAQSAEPSLRKLVALRDNARDERVQLSAAESLLDREGTLNRKIQPTAAAAFLIVTDDQVKAGLRAALESLAPTVDAFGTPAVITSGGSPSPGEETP